MKIINLILIFLERIVVKLRKSLMQCGNLHQYICTVNQPFETFTTQMMIAFFAFYTGTYLIGP